jgi:hypothetical protein
MSWYTFRTEDYPARTYQIGATFSGEKHTMFGHEHTVLAVCELPGKPKYDLQFDGECPRQPETGPHYFKVDYPLRLTRDQKERPTN